MARNSLKASNILWDIFNFLEFRNTEDSNLVSSTNFKASPRSHLNRCLTRS